MNFVNIGRCFVNVDVISHFEYRAGNPNVQGYVNQTEDALTIYFGDERETFRGEKAKEWKARLLAGN
ncbi:hypothetical protein BH09VER1_BH09VER1_43740 [soil metagenome]